METKVAPGKSILIVEDEAGPRESLRMILKPFYNIYAAPDGEQALRIVRTQPIDLVTLDLNMPGLTGIEVLKEIKKLKPDMEVVIITALATLPNAQKAIQYGASDFLSKPFHVSEVITVIKNSFDRLESRTATPGPAG
jgi:DNA-binding NtrC family response regulator